MWPRWWRHGILESNKSKIFLSKYFWISLGKAIKFPPKHKSSFKVNISFIQRTPLTNPCRVKIKNGTLNDVKQFVYLPKVLLKFSKKDIIIKEKKFKDEVWKIVSQKKHPRKNLYCIFPWKRGIWTDIFDWVFSRCLFFLVQGEIQREKKPRTNSVNENLSKIKT